MKPLQIVALLLFSFSAFAPSIARGAPVSVGPDGPSPAAMPSPPSGLRQLFAQSAPRTFRVLNLAGPITSLTPSGMGQGTMLYFDSDAGKPVTVPVPEGKFPRPLPVPAGGEIKLYRYETAPANTPPESIMPCCRAAVAAGKPRKIFVGKVKIPPSHERALVVLTSQDGEDPNRKLQTHVYDGSLSIHKSGTILVFNATASPVALKLGENILEIPARGVQIGPFAGEDGAIQVKLGLRAPDGEWKLALNTVHAARPGYRVLAVIRPLTEDPRTPPLLNLDYEYVPTRGPSLASSH